MRPQPLRPRETDETEENPVRLALAQDPASDRTRRVLLVDDDKLVLKSLQRVLRDEPFELRAAVGGAEALRLLREEPADLVLTDQRMSKMTGLELLDKVRKEWPFTIRVVLTGYTDASTIIDAINRGRVYKYLTKPWDDQALCLSIRRALEQGDLLRENRFLAEHVRRQNKELKTLNARLRQGYGDAVAGLGAAQDMLDSIDVGMVAVDEAGMVVAANTESVRLLGAGEVVGAPAVRVFPRCVIEVLAESAEQADPEIGGAVVGDICWRVRSLAGHGGGRVVLLWAWRPRRVV